MTLNILLCDTFAGLLPKYIPSYASMFMNLFDSVNPDITYQIYDSYNNIFPSNLRPDEIYLITGSNSAVYEEKEWIKSLHRFIRGAFSMKIPLVGICFGHQAIAYALGGEVSLSDKGWGMGMRESRIVEPSARRYFSSNQLKLIYDHHDQVTHLPRGAVRFATSDFCKNEGFILNNHILTFQGHPEYTTAYMHHLLLNHASQESEVSIAKAQESLRTNDAMGQQAARWILSLCRPVNPKAKKGRLIV